MSSNDPRIHVGLSDATIIDVITVTWPDGEVGEWRGQPVNQVLELRQESTAQQRSAPADLDAVGRESQPGQGL